MKKTLFLIGACALALVPMVANAGNHKAQHNNAGIGHCPPGLAKKGTGCLPPGQARKYGRGDFIDGDYIRIRNPERYGLKRGESYYRVGDYVYRVDKDTREVLDLVGAVANVLN